MYKSVIKGWSTLAQGCMNWNVEIQKDIKHNSSEINTIEYFLKFSSL